MKLEAASRVNVVNVDELEAFWRRPIRQPKSRAQRGNPRSIQRWGKGMRVIVMNVMNVMNVWKSATFTTYPYESKELGERHERCTAVFCSRRTSFAKAVLPAAGGGCQDHRANPHHQLWDISRNSGDPWGYPRKFQGLSRG